jgi:cell division protein FtsI/penicillin-binding protein 2
VPASPESAAQRQQPPWADAASPDNVLLDPGQAPGRPPTTPPPGRPPATAPHDHPRRHRRPPRRRSPLTALAKNKRLAVALVITVGVLSVGFASAGFGSQGSPNPTVQAFLVNWEQGHYADAAALTDGAASDVATQLAAAYTDLDATNEFFNMRSVTQHGSTATATYTATVDLAQGGQQWSYVGKFGLTAEHGNWVVNWAPSVINPSLGPGDRLAVQTTYAPRAAIMDSDDQPLIATSALYRVGVYPGKLKDPTGTANGFSGVTALDASQVLGRIQAAPPASFLSLLTLPAAKFDTLWPKLSKVPGLTYQQESGRLFSSSAQEVVGAVGTEDAPLLREEGAAYQPGVTVGLTGLEQTFQNSLIGTPTTAVEVVTASGKVTRQWTLKGGHAGTPVRTTLNGTAQASAVNVVAGQPNSAEIVAVDSASGAIRALAAHSASGVPLPSGGPLNAKVEPGMAFSIVSAAALLSTGVGANHPLPCEPVADVGGVTFTYQPAANATSTFATDFADGCGTAFANMSRTLTPAQLTSTERAFGIGSPWRLQLPAFSGSASAASGEADVASQVTGTGGVLMSPLSMATVAAEVASGTGHSPVLLPTDRSASWQAPLSGASLAELRQLMRLAVTNGAAHAADLPGAPVYGQAGVVQTGKHAYLSWFVGYRGALAVAVLEAGNTPAQAAALAGAFLKTAS